MRAHFRRLDEIYAGFTAQTAEFVQAAACQKACAYCCRRAGSIDITTLEGMRIRNSVAKLPRPRRVTLQKVLAKDMQRREAGYDGDCPFLMKNRACMIYAIRPFACRRIYSLHTCDPENPPLINRQVMKMAQHTIITLQQLDIHGYSGHLSYVLFMLDQPQFMATYAAGECKPEEIMDFGRSHKIFINRMSMTEE